MMCLRGALSNPTQASTSKVVQRADERIGVAVNNASVAGRDARRSMCASAVALLLQVEFLAGPRTQNSPDLAAVHCTLV